MRRIALAALVLLVAGCGGQTQRENLERPAPLVVMTAAIQDDVIRVSPRTVGAGPIELVISNQSDAPQTVTFETDELGGSEGGNRASSSEVAAGGTGRLRIDVREGTYSVSVDDDAIREARVEIGPPRESGQNRLLLP
ncbi:MAG TPA: hypothetical protein VFZ00_18005 [Solirubrobacter sp.]|nr:hypothetical protein [Solirubrobacter sp.]